MNFEVKMGGPNICLGAGEPAVNAAIPCTAAFIYFKKQFDMH